MLTDDARDARRLRDVSAEAKRRIELHLSNWLGVWPGTGAVTVTTSSFRELPGWDGLLRPFVGIISPEQTVISVAQRYLFAVQDAVDDGGLAGLERRLAAIVGHPSAALRRGVFRFQQQIVAHGSLGEWFEPTDPKVPEWLRPFNGGVLLAFDDKGRYAAGVGCKRHDGFAKELAVTTESTHRRLGYAKELVAQAAEDIFTSGTIATYLHRRDNLASARVAEATGFFDRGWEILSLSIPER